ncbi:MAG: LytTR family DNA-binding domain-containing protein [Lachnospiraceae bacterium]|nr:LytTR family DNA-binding domain-containing protein [Lachnospiraceae bacterium]
MEKRECRIGICDDRQEDIARIESALRKGLSRTGQMVRLIISSFLNGEELYAATREKNFDLLFLDIEMPGMDGFELAAKLCMDRPQVGLVFVSAHESFVFDAMEYSPLWFVRKGYLERDMFRVLRKYLQMTSFKGVNYRMKEGFGFRELPIRNILYIEGSGHSLVFKKTDGGMLRKYGSLKSMEEELDGCSFLRIHKNYLVNQEYIKEVGSREVYLMDGSILEMGRDRKNAVREAMRLYDRERYRI